MKKNNYLTFLLPMLFVIVIASCGKDGTVGPQGAQGVTGATGPKGDPGLNGTKFYSGNTAPAASTGVNGDFYINLSSSILYGPKTDDGWGNGVSLKGAAGTNGANGTKIYSGNTPPAASVGVVGDFYFDLSAARLYGPKTTTGWGSGISLVAKSSAKAITSFSFKGPSPAVIATINETDHTITAALPGGTVLTNLLPTIVVSDNATVSPASAAAQDFSKTINYTVTAQDGTMQIYKVTVSTTAAITKVIDCANVPPVLEDLGDGVDYIIKCNISLSGTATVLTIKPGVTIQFDGADAGITITGGAALNMVGTAAKPIVLEGTANTPGSWTGIQIASNNILNKWEYVSVKNAGAGKYQAGLFIGDHQIADNTTSTQMIIEHCTFSNNTGYGIWEYDNDFLYPRVIFAAFNSNAFANNSLSAMRVTIDALGKLDTKSTYTGNGQNFILATGTGGLHNNSTLQALNVPYLIAGNISLKQKLTVLPGVNMLFNIDAGFVLTSGTLIANGTAAQPIKFTGYQSGVGYWLGLSLGNNDPQIALNYCVIDGAGSNVPNASTACLSDAKGAVNFFPSCNSWTTKPVITNCTVTNSGGYGIIYKNGTAVNFSNNTYSGNTLDNVKAF